MSLHDIPAGEPLVLAGDPQARGRGQASDKRVSAERIRAATIARVEAARADGVFDDAAEAYLAAQKAAARRDDPASMAELTGIAEGFGLPVDDLFRHLYLGTVRDLKAGASYALDGCSAWAAGGPEGPLLVKNRDFTGVHIGVQRVFRHEGPDLRCGPILCVGSLGSPGVYSSGINARGLALADTQVAVTAHRVGWLRYFLMTRILAECATVAEALAFIRARSHAGGGTLVLADADGHAAAVELGATAIAVEEGPIAFRTNHFISPELAGATLRAGEDAIADSSTTRLRYLSGRVGGRTWTMEAAAAFMATHRGDEPDAAPLCQHGAADASQTISTAVYSCSLRKLRFCEGNPCTGRWLTFDLS